MRSHVLDLSANEIVDLLRAETRANLGQPELDLTLEKEYLVESRLRPGRAVDALERAASVATLTVEPRVELGFWVLEISLRKAIDAPSAPEALGPARAELSLDEFAAELLAPGAKHEIVRLYAVSPEAREHFERWLADLRARRAGAAERPESRREAAK